MHEYMLENKLKPVVNKDSVLPELKKIQKLYSEKSLQEKEHFTQNTIFFPKKKDYSIY